jgi:hypothetical protein
VPYDPAEWTRVCGVLSGLMLGVAEQERCTGPVAPPLGGGAAMRAWGRLSAALASARRAPSSAALRLQPWLEFVTVDLGEVAVLGAAARQLGVGLLPAPSLAPAPGAVTEALERAAGAGTTTPSKLVVEFARVHGVLDLDLGEDLLTLRRWGADGPLFVRPPGSALAAHRRISARVHAMWSAGAGFCEDDAG